MREERQETEERRGGNFANLRYSTGTWLYVPSSQRMPHVCNWNGFFLFWSRVDFFHGAHAGAQLRSLADTRVDSFYSGAAWIFSTRRLCFSVLQGASETRRRLRAPILFEFFFGAPGRQRYMTVLEGACFFVSFRCFGALVKQ